jgi:hypothetical protein
MGVGACEAGVEAGVCASWFFCCQCFGLLVFLAGLGGNAWERERTAAAGLYDTELREKTRFWSARPVLRRSEAAAVVPLM